MKTQYFQVMVKNKYLTRPEIIQGLYTDLNDFLTYNVHFHPEDYEWTQLVPFGDATEVPTRQD